MTMTDPFGIVLPGKGHYTVGPCLGHGAQGSVHVVFDRDGKETKWAVKMAKLPKTKAAPKKKKSMEEIHADSIYKESLIYQHQLVEHQGSMIASLPGSVDGKKIDTYGEAEGFRFLVMERMHNTLFGMLDTLIDDACNSTSIDCAPLAIRLIDILQVVHQHHYLLTDVKPDNLMIASPSTASKRKKKASSFADDLAQRLRLVDLGLLRTFRKMGKHEDDVGTKGLQGTPLYSSLHVHGNHTPSRRDDVYGVGLVLAEFVIRLHALAQGTTGDFERHDVPNYLPWALESSDEAIGTAKEMQVSDIQSDFYQSMPPQAAQIVYEFLQQAHDTRFKQTPDYQAFKDLVADLQVPCMAKKSSSSSKTAKKKKVSPKRSSGKTMPAADKKCKPVPFTLDAFSSSKPAASTTASTEKKLKTVPFTLESASSKPTAAKKPSSAQKGKPVPYVASAKPTAAKKPSSAQKGKPVLYVAPSKPTANNASVKSPAPKQHASEPSTDQTIRQGLRRSARLSSPKRTRSTTQYGILDDSSDSEKEESPSKIPKAVDSDGDKVMEEESDDDTQFYSAAQKEDTDDDDVEMESVEEMDVDMEGGTPASRRTRRSAGKENLDDMDAAKTKKTTSKKKFMVARVVVTGGPYAGQEWTLDPGKDISAICIGSNPSNSRKGEPVKLAGDRRIHANHATLEIIPDKRVLKVKVTDHKTDGGTIVNKDTVPSGKQRVAFRSDTIQVGGTTLTIYSA